jgi:hypothetical protein
MTAMLNRPDWFFGPAMNADPNDLAAVPTWTDMTAQLRGASALARGRQFELATTLAADPEVVVRDPDELLNPENTASTFYGNILPYRSMLWLGMWPNVGSTTASAGNLLNASTWRVPYDCSFESYTAGATVAWITAVGATTPVVGTTTPHAGTKDLTWTVAGTATVQGVSWQLPCIPGRQYTVSAYVRQTSASTQGIYVDAVVGSTTTTTGAYVRLTNTFTATQPYHTAYVQTSGTAVAGTVLVDDVQHEQGAAATTAVTTGSVIYPVMRNLIESYNRTWGSRGFEGYVTMPCVDTTAALSAIRISTELVSAYQALAPAYWWPMGDGSDTVYFAERSGNNGPPLVAVQSKYGAGTYSSSPGATLGIVGDPDATGESLDQNGTDNKGWVLRSTGPVNLGDNSATYGITISGWMVTTQTSVDNLIQIQGMGLQDDGITIWPYMQMLGAGTNAGTFAGLFTGTTGASAHFADTSAATYTNHDGLPHFFAATLAVAANVVTLKFYVDGTLNGSFSGSATTAYGSATPDFRTTVLTVLGDCTKSFRRPAQGGTVAHIAAWNRALSATEVTNLYAVGATAYSGELSGTRVSRHFTLGGYAGVAPRISAGTTTMGPPTYGPTIDLQTDTVNTTVAEGGCEWIAPDGAPVFEGRQERWLRLTPTWTLGENVGGGEIPYEGDIEYAYDGFFLYGDVTVSRNNGAVTIGGSTADIATAHKRFFGKAYDQNSDFATDQQAQDQANWIFYTHNRPASRIARITVSPDSAPALWPFALGVEVGQRIRVNRRPKAANAGAGITVSLDFFVENVTHDFIDMDAGTWSTTLLLSPIGTVTSQTGLTFQPWIVEDPTYGVLDSTTVLGY